jgi:hypothetical protein
MVVRATGVGRNRIRAGMQELEDLATEPSAERPGQQRIRRPGGGRKRLTETDPTLLEDLESLVEPLTRGDPESALRWTCKSTRKLAAELVHKGHQVSATKVGYLLWDLGYRLPANAKTLEGKQHLDRNAQFEHINTQTEAFIARNAPVISVDTKKKELVGEFKNGGREWQPLGEPVPVGAHDFPSDAVGKAVPYGVYDLGRNEGWVSVGVDHLVGVRRRRAIGAIEASIFVRGVHRRVLGRAAAVVARVGRRHSAVEGLDAAVVVRFAAGAPLPPARRA